MSKALEKYQQRATAVNSMLCVGLDSNIDRLPQRFLKTDQPQFKFNQWIIDQTHKHVCAYKPNLAFYEARGVAGWKELKLTLEYLKSEYPDIFLIADAKRGDIGSTNQGYVQAVFDKLGFDAVTLNPYLGQEALQPFLDRADKVSIILCRTSNPGAGELQDLTANKQPLWQRLAENVVKKWNQNNNCMLVVGATCPEELEQIRQITGSMPLLVPGIGAQGGDLEAVLAAGLDEKGRGLIINSSRSIIFANNPASEAKKLKNNINQFINNE
jgi:orotidine-5'-phosphate decarboxylase